MTSRYDIAHGRGRTYIEDPFATVEPNPVNLSHRVLIEWRYVAHDGTEEVRGVEVIAALPYMTRRQAEKIAAHVNRSRGVY